MAMLEGPGAALALLALGASAACTWAAALLLRWLAAFRTLGGLPSPAGGAGSLLGPRHHTTLLDWSEALGPLFRIRMLWVRVVVVASPRLAHTLLRELPAGDKSRVTYDVLNKVRAGRGPGKGGGGRWAVFFVFLFF